MKTDLHCSTLHQVCPHCVAVTAGFHYSSLSRWVWQWKKRWKVSSLSYPHPNKQKSISSIGLRSVTGCLALYWCSSHTSLWHLFSLPLLALHCPCHMASEKPSVEMCVCARLGRLRGHRRVLGGWPADKDSPLHQWALWIHGDKPGWIGEQKPRRSRLCRKGGRGCLDDWGISKMDVSGD